MNAAALYLFSSFCTHFTNVIYAFVEEFFKEKLSLKMTQGLSVSTNISTVIKVSLSSL